MPMYLHPPPLVRPYPRRIPSQAASPQRRNQIPAAVMPSVHYGHQRPQVLGSRKLLALVAKAQTLRACREKRRVKAYGDIAQRLDQDCLSLQEQPKARALLQGRQVVVAHLMTFLVDVKAYNDSDQRTRQWQCCPRQKHLANNLIGIAIFATGLDEQVKNQFVSRRIEVLSKIRSKLV